MSSKNSSNLDNLKYEYIYGSIHKDGRRSFRSLDNLIKEYELAASTVYRHSSKEQWKDQRIAFRAVNYLTLDRFNRVLGRYSLRLGTAV